MIVGYELHVETEKSIADMLAHFKASGCAVDFKMCKDSHHGMFEIKHPKMSKIYSFKIKLYEELGATKHYEIMSWDKEQFALSEDWFKDV